MNRDRVIYKNIDIIALRYRIDYDTEKFDWIIIYDHPLPRRWGFPDNTDILIKIPRKFPVQPPEHFYTDKKLKLGKHSYDSGWNDLSNLGWSKYCLHFNNNWQVGKDDLITTLECIKLILDGRA